MKMEREDDMNSIAETLMKSGEEESMEIVLELIKVPARDA